MGKIKQGILGGFSGKVGPVIGTSWKGRAIMRAQALSIHDPQTDSQKHIRAKFRLVNQFIGRLRAAINIGYKNYAATESQGNVAMADIINTAVHGTGTAVSLDYPLVTLSKGSLLNPTGVNAAAEMGQGVHAIKVTWTDNTGEGPDVLGEDKVFVALYNSDKKRSAYSDNGTREGGTITVNHPANWSGDSVQVYLFTHSADNKRTSDSLFINEISAQ